MLTASFSGADAEDTTSEEGVTSEEADSDDAAIRDVGSPAGEAGSEEATAEVECATSLVDEGA